jgi:hypothetical protein
MENVSSGKAYKRLMISVLYLVFWLLPICILAQDYPDLYFFTGYSSHLSYFGSGPNFTESETQNYLYDPWEPLLIKGMHYVYGYANDESYYSHIDTTYTFQGYVEYNSDLVVVHYPTEIYDNWTVYRVSKIRNDGYYLEDSYSHNPLSGHRLTDIHYYYNENNKLIRKVWIEQGPLEFWNCEYTLDEQGRRVNELVSSSTDSLNWVPRSRAEYTYTGAQIPELVNGTHQYEKFSAYLSEYSTYYLNDDWVIQSVTQTYATNGIWGSPFLVQYNIVFGQDETYVEIPYYMSNMRFDSKGLPKTMDYDLDTYSGTKTFTFGNTREILSATEDIPMVSHFKIYPNPVKGLSKIIFYLPDAAPIQIKTYNLRGQFIKQELFDYQPHVIKETNWEAVDQAGKQLAHGIYLLRFIMGSKIETGRVIVLE